MRTQPAMPAVLSSTAVACDLQVEVPDCSRLLELPGLVPDPRRRRGIRHPQDSADAGPQAKLSPISKYSRASSPVSTIVTMR